MLCLDFLIVLSLILGILPQSSSNEDLEKLQRFLPGPSGDEVLNFKRFQQIMQGTGPSESGMKEPKFKSDSVDVKTELGKLNISHTFQPDWPSKQKILGSVSAVTFDKAGNVVVFHRVDRVWNEATFNLSNYFMQKSLGAISENTVVAFNKKTGKVVYEWGKNLFYMPHGLTIDNEDNVWVTDVALHQVMKFGPKGSNNTAQLLLGTAMKPGLKNEFCKPTSVAVLPNGDFFVADGYCNARIMKFSKSGETILIWGQHTFSGLAYETAPINSFAIPHALTLAPDLGLLCVADRENGRVQCFYSNNGTAHSQYHSEIIGDRLFSVAYAPVGGGQLYVINGPTGIQGQPNQVNGFIISMKTKNVIAKFVPQNINYRNPHDIAVTPDGSEIYIAELDPKRVLKFSSKRSFKTVSISSAKPTATIVTDSNSNEVNSISNLNTQNSGSVSRNVMSAKSQPGATALILIVLVLMFGLITFGIIVLISKRQKRGCSLFGQRHRRHAWDPTGEKPFKLGNLLNSERNKRGFEKLNQNASDEEMDASTNMLTSAQFA